MTMIKIRDPLLRLQRLHVGRDKVHPLQLESLRRRASHRQMTQMYRVKGAAVERNVLCGMVSLWIVHSVGKIAARTAMARAGMIDETKPSWCGLLRGLLGNLSSGAAFFTAFLATFLTAVFLAAGFLAAAFFVAAFFVAAIGILPFVCLFILVSGSASTSTASETSSSSAFRRRTSST